MTTSYVDAKGIGRIQFRNADGQKKTVTLGATDEATLAKIRSHIDSILECGQLGIEPPATTRAWIAQVLPTALGAKLAAVGLVAPRDLPAVNATPAKTQLGPFLDAYKARRIDLKPASLIVLQNCAENLIAFFGKERDLSTINPGEAGDFQRWLLTASRRKGNHTGTAGMSAVTCSKRLQWCSTFWRDAIDRGLAKVDPFAKLKKSKKSNPERQQYIPAETIQRLIDDHCPDAEWRCLLALSRFAGLRVPTEIFELRWSNINLPAGEMTVVSPKTEHIGKGKRKVPIFPQVRPYLEDLWATPTEGQDFVFVNLRRKPSARRAIQGFWSECNLRQRFLGILKRAGVAPWPKLFHQMRSSCQTDLTNRFPSHTVCGWLGNTVEVANAHYLQTTPEHWAAAIEVSPKALPKALPAGGGTGVNGEQSETGKAKNPLVLAGFEEIEWRIGDLNP